MRTLDALHHAGYTIPVVLTRPDRPSGRGLRLGASPVAGLASACGLDVRKPLRLRDEATVAALTAVELDVLVVAAYGMILPPAVLTWPAHGCLNLHASLLPRWRGAAPIARAIEAGDRESGITIMQMDAGLDTGPVVRQQDAPIGARETAGTLHDTLAALGAELMLEVLADLALHGRLASTPQPPDGVTWAVKLAPDDTLIDWGQPAAALDRRVRALAPAPGAVTRWQSQPVKVLEALPVVDGRAVVDARADAPDLDERIRPGSVLRVRPEGIEVACGSAATPDTLRVIRVQPAGGRAMSAAAFAAGRRIARGARFG